jgi:hypothetical protein
MPISVLSCGLNRVRCRHSAIGFSVENDHAAQQARFAAGRILRRWRNPYEMPVNIRCPELGKLVWTGKFKCLGQAVIAESTNEMMRSACGKAHTWKVADILLPQGPRR